jgi:Lon protease-like protein
MSAVVELVPPDAAADPVDSLCRQVLQAVIEKLGANQFPAPLRLDDASWVGYRLAEVLPLGARVKQELLEATDAGKRLERLRELLVQQGLKEREA